MKVLIAEKLTLSVSGSALAVLRQVTVFDHHSQSVFIWVCQPSSSPKSRTLYCKFFVFFCFTRFRFDRVQEQLARYAIDDKKAIRQKKNGEKNNQTIR